VLVNLVEVDELIRSYLDTLVTFDEVDLPSNA
jgi:hypothetical protein